MEINYVGELLWPGWMGSIFIFLAFAASLIAAWFFYVQRTSGDISAGRVARLFYYIHAVGVFGASLTLLYLMIGHRYEYYYVWQHTSEDLPLRYIFSAFWEGQEGSFLLWIFWQTVMGVFLLVKRPPHLEGIMFFYLLVQAFLLSMLLGISIGPVEIGSNPFVLLREYKDFVNFPFTQNPNYLQMIEPRGLNPLLQNYWMTIHPPMLFLGFASVLIPFSMALDALWRKSFFSWIKHALPWTFLGVAALGTGILMGGAWAYEALSFGGFWAWDPVENSSLVPWIILVAAGHMMLIVKKIPGHVVSLFLFTILSYLTVLYSTYLTRSGILGETSVHSFADGLPGQLIALIVFFLLLSTIIFIRSGILKAKSQTSDIFLSREFWMLLGNILLFLSALQIISTTSIPVFNKVFGTNFSPPNDAVEHYNSWQSPFAMFILLLMGVTQFLKFGQNETRELLKKIAPSFVLAALITLISYWVYEFKRPMQLLLLFTGLWSMLVNITFFVRRMQTSIYKSGKFLAHAGFALIIIGSVFSMGLQKTISVNTSGIDIRMKNEKGDANLSNILLIQGDTLPMGHYFVTLDTVTFLQPYIYYHIKYFQKTPGGFSEVFTLKPTILLNKKMGNVAEPSTKHFLHKDIFTHVTYADITLFTQKPDQTADFITDTLSLSPGDTAFASGSFLIFDKIVPLDSLQIKSLPVEINENDLAVYAHITLQDLSKKIDTLKPVLIIHQQKMITIADTTQNRNLIIQFQTADPDAGKVKFILKEKKNNDKQFVVMQAVEFPLINLLWTGCVLMIIGTLISVIKRWNNA